ncbi:DUF38 domain-containing protein [Caenorhabditis elegans]|uniref:DUF38 domain-containing protein n=1 Tax=Caenorhabditis elegans TaxID=6239 RepID=O45671_CAEEL|nr:DUF38 domain-containing protein [Caenorhabditis elegans]CAB07255.5 DUF38 domain-containing protein [Caenorhabditis elegans]|eukprot:NP_001343591.1 Uncharacterized protein CELE_K10G4.5 [Caenorhabditis elegans]
MSHAFRLTKQTAPITNITLKLNGESPSLIIETERVSYTKPTEVFYHGRTNDTWITYEPQQPIKIKDRDCIDVMCDDLEIMLNSECEKLFQFVIEFCRCEDENLSLTQLQSIYDRLVSMSRAKKINALFGKLIVNDIHQIRKAFSCFNIRTLTTIGFEFVSDDFECQANIFKDIMEIEQLEIIDMMWVQFKVENLSIDDLRAIKKVSLNYEGNCKAIFSSSNMNHIADETLDDLFGPPIGPFIPNSTRALGDGVMCIIEDAEIVIQKFTIPKHLNNTIVKTTSTTGNDTPPEIPDDINDGCGLRVLATAVIIENILQHVGLTTILALRLVSWPVRRCLDRVKPDSKIEVLAIQMKSLDYLTIEVLDDLKHMKHNYDTMYKHWYDMYWDADESANEYHYPPYKLFHIPIYYLNNFETYPFPNPFSVNIFSKEELREVFANRSSFSDNLRLILLNQKSPINYLKLMLPWFAPDFEWFRSMSYYNDPEYRNVMKLKIKSPICEQCEVTGDNLPFGICAEHETELHKLMQKCQNRMEERLPNQFDYARRIDKFIDYIGTVLKSVGHKIPVKSLSIQAYNQSSMMHILPHLDSRSLRSISIQKPVEDKNKVPCSWIQPLEIDEICQLEQWKSTKIVDIEHVIDIADIKTFGHFSEADVKLASLTMKGILCLKTEFLLSEDFVKFKASFETSNVDESIYEVSLLGWPFRRPTHPNTNHPSVWFFKYQESSDYLHILYYELSRKIIFTRKEASSVPMNL